MTVPAHQLAVLAEHVECALETGRAYVEVPSVVLAALLPPPPQAVIYGVERPCPRCHGSGRDPEHPKNGCWACGGTGEEILYLCGACGAIRAKLDFGAWKRDDEGEHWIPSEDGDSDPMLRCPACGDEHRDIDSDAGLEEGTLAQLTASRHATVAEYGDLAFQSEYQPEPLP